MTATSDRMKWTPLEEVVEVVQSLDRLDWVCDFRRKYLKIHIDTRDKACLLMDRDDNILSQEEYDSLKNGTYNSYEKQFNHGRNTNTITSKD
jgi:hypothetical protein